MVVHRTVLPNSVTGVRVVVVHRTCGVGVGGQRVAACGFVGGQRLAAHSLSLGVREEHCLYFLLFEFGPV